MKTKYEFVEYESGKIVVKRKRSTLGIFWISDYLNSFTTQPSIWLESVFDTFRSVEEAIVALNRVLDQEESERKKKTIKFVHEVTIKKVTR